MFQNFGIGFILRKGRSMARKHPRLFKLMILPMIVMILVRSTQSLTLRQNGRQERNMATCRTTQQDLQYPFPFGIVMTLKNGTIRRNGSIDLEVLVPSNIKFTKIDYTVVGDPNGAEPNSNYKDLNAPTYHAAIDESGIGELKIRNIPASIDNKMYIKTYLKQLNTEIRCMNTFTFGQAVQANFNTTPSAPTTLSPRLVLPSDHSSSNETQGFSTAAALVIGLIIGFVIGAAGAAISGFVLYKIKYRQEMAERQVDCPENAVDKPFFNYDSTHSSDLE